MDNPGARTYTIQELAERCGVTPRTIRFYIEEGLLPPPLQEGRIGLYTDEHVERLELIRRLKEAFLPLRQIHRLVNSLSSAEIRALLETLPRAPQPRVKSVTNVEDIPQREGGGFRLYQRVSGSLSEEIAEALRSSPADEETSPVQEETSRAYEEAQAMLLHKARREQLAPDDEEFARWQRIIIVPGLEIHIRESNDYHFVSRVRQLVEFARRLFRSE